MKSLVDFRLSDNPLTSPPASVSISILTIRLFSLKSPFCDSYSYVPSSRDKLFNKTVCDYFIHQTTVSFSHRLSAHGIADDCKTGAFRFATLFDTLFEFMNQYLRYSRTSISFCILRRETAKRRKCGTSFLSREYRSHALKGDRFHCRFQLCIRGRTHIFKYLERQAAKHERARGGRTRRAPLDARGHATLDTRSHRRHNVDSGYSTSDGVDKRWSQEIHSAVSFTVALVAFPLSLHLLHMLYNYFLAKLFGEPAAESPVDF